MISRSAEYALRAVLCLAAHPAPAMTTRQVSAATQIPAGYLAKVFQALVRAGLVASQRGINGGFVLAKPPEKLTLLDVVRVCDPTRRIATCPLGIVEHATCLCALHQRLDTAAALVEDALAASTVADLLPQTQVTP